MAASYRNGVMTMRRLVWLGLLLFVGAVVAQLKAPEVVKGTAFLDVDKVRQGATFRIALVADIKERYHLQAPNPPKGFIATQLSVDAPKGFEVVRVWYPPTVTKEVLGQKLPLYEGKQTFAALLRADKALKVGKYTLTLKLRYQACNDKTCFPPKTLTVTVPVEVVPSDASVKPVNAEVFKGLPADLKGGAPAPSGDGRSEKSSSRSSSSGLVGMIGDALMGRHLGLGLILVFLGGVLMNLSPCVFPMVPVVIGYFGRQAEGVLARRFLLGFAFVLGLVVMYASLGLVAALTRTMFGSVLQNGWVLLTVALVLFVLALSMFGAFEFMTPQSAAKGFQTGVQLVGAPQFALKLVGAFLMGLLIGVVAAPCVGPVVIALLGAAPLLDATTLFALFVTLSLGLGLPYLLLAIFVGAAQRLRSGKWNLWVNRLFGVILLGAAIYFGVQSAYAFGWLKGEHPWQPFTPQALAKARQQSKPVVIDFWATWCLACKELEHKTFSDPQVQKVLRQFVTLQVDMTTGKDPVANEVAKRFQVRGLPTVVFIGRDGRERKELRLEGFEPPDEFLKRLNAVLSEPEASEGEWRG